MNMAIMPSSLVLMSSSSCSFSGLAARAPRAARRRSLWSCSLKSPLVASSASASFSGAPKLSWVLPRRRRLLGDGGGGLSSSSSSSSSLRRGRRMGQSLVARGVPTGRGRGLSAKNQRLSKEYTPSKSKSVNVSMEEPSSNAKGFWVGIGLLFIFLPLVILGIALVTGDATPGTGSFAPM
uniref:Uncharacterized protein n=1 Tax=Pycnococcus provasolii TaxID=41880 RepID=A0A7R9XP31_9CHLO|mmetsp:Transcript_1231/g.2741  ORF Transcript_1231/g.2741 Transcript_1231/m.2741 type:complete len:180 (+) Transcript_1231:12-551(+)